MKRFKFYINESVELDESITKMSDARLKFHVLKNVPHGSYTKKELSAEHDRRKKTGGAEYAAVKPSLNEENIDEAMTHSTWNVQHPTRSTKSYKVKARTAGEAIRKAHKAAIDAGHMKSNVPNTVFQSKHVQKVNEEVEELDEISKDTLRSYAAKSYNQANTLVKQSLSDQPKSVQKASTAAFKRRSSGIKAAGRRLGSDEMKKIHADVVREEVEELDELSKKTLGSYVRKAADSMGNAAHSLGKKSERSDEVDRMTNRHMPDKYNVRDNMKKALDADEKSQRKDREVIGKRMYGIRQATQRLTKEEVELDEARKSDSYQFTHKPGDPESEKRLADLKKSVKGTGKRVVLQGRLGKDNPNAHKYSKDAPSAKYKDGKRVNSDVSGKSGGHSHQRIQKADAAHHDVYVYDRNESVEQIDELSKKTLGSYVKKASRNLAGREYKRGAEKDASTSNLQKSYKRDMGIAKAVDKLTKEEVEQIDEISKATLRKAGGQMLRKGLSDDPKAAKHLKYANMASAKLYPNQYKNSPLKAKVPATESVENIDELNKSTLGSYVKKAAGSMAGKTAVAAAQASSSMGKSSPDIKRGIVNRMKGITRATDKLAKEEADLEEKLVGGQKKLDHNKNGKIDAHDFHLMRKKKMKEEVEGLDEISRDLARRYIRKVADKTNTGELSVKQVEKRRPGVNLAGKKAYPSIAGEPKVRATD